MDRPEVSEVTHPSRQKGNRFETLCLHELAARGMVARKVPLSGSLGGEHAHDLILGSHRIECKHYKRWLAKFYAWLAKGPDFLFVKEDRGEILVVMTLDTFARLHGPNAEW